jgi:hypothetical protein
MRVGKVVTVVGVAACALGVGSASVAAATPQGGKIRVFVTSTSETKGKILITGAIGDYGTTVSQDANGKPNPNGNFEKVTLQQGGFIVDGTELNKKLNSAKPTINKANCSFSFTGTGPTTVGNGTGAYAGISGNIAITVTFAEIAKKTAKGCSPNGNGLAGYQSITGSGTVSFK